MKHLVIGLLLAATATACVTTVPTYATITRLDAPNDFRSCTVQLGWTDGDLIKACGPPAIIRYWTEPNFLKCWGYQSIATNFAGQGPGGYFVCMQEHKRSPFRKAGAGPDVGGGDLLLREAKSKPQTVWSVVAVYPVQSIAGEMPPGTRPAGQTVTPALD